MQGFSTRVGPAPARAPAYACQAGFGLRSRLGFVAWLACTPVSVLAAEARQGPAAAWDFKSVQGDRVPDVSGNGHDGVRRGAKFVKIPAGTALASTKKAAT